jgi:protocatechuate 3,4-dioxygenase beta subunit
MQYRGQMAADDLGRFSFHTLKPGRYLNGARFRPSHIHVKIWVDGRELKTTQLYFEGDPFIEGDAFVVDGLILSLAGDESTGQTGSFDFSVEV